MNKTHFFVCFLALVGCKTATCNVQVRHLQLNGTHMVDTSQNNYAITSPSLRQNNWQTVSVNGDNVVIFGQNCEQNVRTLQSLNDAEKNTLQDAKQQLMALETGGTSGGSGSYGVARYTLNGNGNGVTTSMSNSNMQMSSYSNNGASISKSDENNFAISKPNLPNNIGMILSMGSSVAFVYNDGQVQMKPSTCLQPAEQQLLQQIRSEMQQADQQFKNNMHQFQNNMQNMQHQMQQNMRNMQQQMQSSFGNMFGNGAFPMNNPAAAATAGNGNYGFNLPYASAGVGPVPVVAPNGLGLSTSAFSGVPGAYSSAGTGLLGTIFNGLSRGFQQLGQRTMQPAIQQQAAGFWPSFSFG